MSELDGVFYEKTDNQSIEVGKAAIKYIFEGATKGLPLDFRGLDVYGVISALRESDDALHGESSTLDEAQQKRLNEIEADIDESVANDLQYYPFGHNREKYGKMKFFRFSD